MASLVVLIFLAGIVASAVGYFRTASLASYAPVGPAHLSQIPSGVSLQEVAAVAGRVRGIHVLESHGDQELLLSCSPSLRSVYRGAGLFVRIRRATDQASEPRLYFDAKPKVPLFANPRRGVVEVEREIRMCGLRQAGTR